MAEKWTDSIGRPHPRACGFIAICPSCRAVMHTQNLSGVLKFNEHGWGVWSERHAENCTLQSASDTHWHRIENKELYTAFCKLADDFEENCLLVQAFLSKKIGFAGLRRAIIKRINYMQVEADTDALAEAAILDAAIAYNEAMAQNEPTSQVEDCRDAAEVSG